MVIDYGTVPPLCEWEKIDEDAPERARYSLQTPWGCCEIFKEEQDAGTWCWKFVPKDESGKIASEGGFSSGAEEARRSFEDWFFFDVFFAKTHEYKVAVEGGLTGEISLLDEGPSATWRVIDEGGTVLGWGVCDDESNVLDNANDAWLEMEACLDENAKQE